MLYLILAAVVLVVTVVFLLCSFGAPKEPKTDRYGKPTQPSKGSFRVAVGICLFILLGLTAAFSATTVSPRAVGIVTSFGKYQATLPAGFHWTAPWSGVEEFPTQVQFLEMNGTEGQDNKKGGVQVNFAGGGKGIVDATVRWRINEKNAEDLWKKYKDFEKVRDQLVLSSARDAVRVAVGGYSATDAQSGSNVTDLTGKIAQNLQSNVADDGVQIDSISVTAVILDDKTQDAIQKVIIAEQDKARAKVEQERAEIEKTTNEIRQKAGILNDGGLRRYCLELTNSWDASKNGPLPATWNCLGSTGSPVVVGGGK